MRASRECIRLCKCLEEAIIHNRTVSASCALVCFGDSAKIAKACQLCPDWRSKGVLFIYSKLMKCIVKRIDRQAEAHPMNVLVVLHQLHTAQ